MSDYYGKATLEDWLAEEVFNLPTVPQSIVALFERWRGAVQANISSWQDSDDGDGNRLSWRGWGFGFEAIPEAEREDFERAVAQGRELLELHLIAQTEPRHRAPAPEPEADTGGRTIRKILDRYIYVSPVGGPKVDALEVELLRHMIEWHEERRDKALTERDEARGALAKLQIQCGQCICGNGSTDEMCPVCIPAVPKGDVFSQLAAALAFARKVKKIGTDPAFTSVFTVADMHHCGYRGENWGKELTELERQLGVLVEQTVESSG